MAGKTRPSLTRANNASAVTGEPETEKCCTKGKLVPPQPSESKGDQQKEKKDADLTKMKQGEEGITSRMNSCRRPFHLPMLSFCSLFGLWIAVAGREGGGLLLSSSDSFFVSPFSSPQSSSFAGIDSAATSHVDSEAIICHGGDFMPVLIDATMVEIEPPSIWSTVFEQDGKISHLGHPYNSLNNHDHGHLFCVDSATTCYDHVISCGLQIAIFQSHFSPLQPALFPAPSFLLDGEGGISGAPPFFCMPCSSITGIFSSANFHVDSDSEAIIDSVNLVQMPPIHNTMVEIPLIWGTVIEQNHTETYPGTTNGKVPQILSTANEVEGEMFNTSTTERRQQGRYFSFSGGMEVMGAKTNSFIGNFYSLLLLLLLLLLVAKVRAQRPSTSSNYSGGVLQTNTTQKQIQSQPQKLPPLEPVDIPKNIKRIGKCVCLLLLLTYPPKIVGTVHAENSPFQYQHQVQKQHQQRQRQQANAHSMTKADHGDGHTQHHLNDYAEYGQGDDDNQQKQKYHPVNSNLIFNPHTFENAVGRRHLTSTADVVTAYNSANAGDNIAITTGTYSAGMFDIRKAVGITCQEGHTCTFDGMNSRRVMQIGYVESAMTSLTKLIITRGNSYEVSNLLNRGVCE